MSHGIAPEIALHALEMKYKRLRNALLFASGCTFLAFLLLQLSPSARAQKSTQEVVLSTPDGSRTLRLRPDTLIFSDKNGARIVFGVMGDDSASLALFARSADPDLSVYSSPKVESIARSKLESHVILSTSTYGNGCSPDYGFIEVQSAIPKGTYTCPGDWKPPTVTHDQDKSSEIFILAGQAPSVRKRVWSGTRKAFEDL